MPVKKVISGRCPVKIWTDDVETSATQQLIKLSTLPFVHRHIAVMPDVHAGIGSTVGTVLPTIKAIIPAAVGVDIGCGMVATKLSIRGSQLPDNLALLRTAIEAAVPHGRSDNGGPNDKGRHQGAVHFGDHVEVLELFLSYPAVLDENPGLDKARRSAPAQLGTLGTGNHFIELCIDTDDNVWVMLHSGSRGVGNAIGRYYIDRAKEQMERWHVNLADPDLAFLPEGEQLFNDYVRAVGWAQQYAKINREVMLRATLKAIAPFLPAFEQIDTAINCHHNYVERENHFRQNVWVTRKGAVRARLGELGIIPGSMGAKSFIVRGKGNEDSFCSCSHGAGRRMSRGAAFKQFNVVDMEAQTAGVECRKDEGVIDEIPAAYKNIDEVMANQSDLVDIVATLKQVVCVKG